MSHLIGGRARDVRTAAMLALIGIALLAASATRRIDSAGGFFGAGTLLLASSLLCLGPHSARRSPCRRGSRLASGLAGSRTGIDRGEASFRCRWLQRRRSSSSPWTPSAATSTSRKGTSSRGSEAMRCSWRRSRPLRTIRTRARDGKRSISAILKTSHSSRFDFGLATMRAA